MADGSRSVVLGTLNFSRLLGRDECLGLVDRCRYPHRLTKWVHPVRTRSSQPVLPAGIERRRAGEPIVTSNKVFGRWGEVFGDDVVAAVIDRLVHHASPSKAAAIGSRTAPGAEPPAFGRGPPQRCQRLERVSQVRLSRINQSFTVFLTIPLLTKASEWSVDSPQNAVEMPETPSTTMSIPPSHSCIGASRNNTRWPSKCVGQEFDSLRRLRSIPPCRSVFATSLTWPLGSSI
jgi:hypothetical protein